MWSMIVPMMSCLVTLVLDSPDPGCDRVKAFRQKIAVATRWIIINLEIRLKVMSDPADRTCSLTA